MTNNQFYQKVTSIICNIKNDKDLNHLYTNFKANNLSFQNGSIYSYELAIGQLEEVDKTLVLYLHGLNNSRTTNRHISNLAYSIPKDIPILKVDAVRSHHFNVNKYGDEIYYSKSKNYINWYSNIEQLNKLHIYSNTPLKPLYERYLIYENNTQVLNMIKSYDLNIKTLGSQILKKQLKENE